MTDTFGTRIIREQVRHPVAGEMRTFAINDVIAGATIAEMREWLDRAFGITFPASARRDVVAAKVREVSSA